MQYPASNIIRKHSRAFFTTGINRAGGCRIVRIFFLVLTLSVSGYFAAAQKTDYEVQANIIYHFTKYINWPDSRKTGDFVIGVLGESAIYWELKESLVNKKAGSQNIIIKQYASSATTFDCHILFLSEEEGYQVKRITTQTAEEPVLIVSESDGLASKGSCINFAVVSDRLSLEINKTNIEKRGLDIATELLQLGRVVR